ncbi:forespore regulator of the sigma-K checkpoint [Natronobacillus azotifigens]|uniref:BofC C-terminal domain-containing protein n=1 Tax=Natronobacillus azotifigens TaxID=472978 RepID=A0A9J6RAI9_9BACI|nr:BofC C-terminal domain-containing protein [Natronobacillus azotifigens]MCZ0702374.1 BofC C-terminal domain-containing protein [Natronobacillus azotifigens]
MSKIAEIGQANSKRNKNLIEVNKMNRRKRFIMLAIAILGLFILISLNPVDEDLEKVEEKSENEIETAAAIDIENQNNPDDLAVIEVILQEQYIDGRMETKIIEETISAMEDFWSEYSDYQLIDQKVGQLTFRKQIDDVSTYLKKVGHFGLYDDTLTIFEGEPEYEQVIQSFYHIDKNELTKEDIERLNNGIKIDSKETYQQTLEVFRSYSPTEQVQG